MCACACMCVCVSVSVCVSLCVLTAANKTTRPEKREAEGAGRENEIISPFPVKIQLHEYLRPKRLVFA